jgi:CspA family cold shock protein
MASDGMGSKGTGIGPNREAIGDLADEATSVIELSGVIKWFDVSKGFGFIVPDNGMPDVLLHVTCLRRDGYQVAYEGARVVCEVLQRPRGLQAFRVLSMDDSTAIHPAQLPPPRTHVSVTPTSGWNAHRSNGSIVPRFRFLTRGDGLRHFRPYGNARRWRHRCVRQFCLSASAPAKGLMAARREGVSGPASLTHRRS